MTRPSYRHVVAAVVAARCGDAVCETDPMEHSTCHIGALCASTTTATTRRSSPATLPGIARYSRVKPVLFAASHVDVAGSAGM
jgi:hypothetical protein